MPIYEYRCENCGAKSEFLQKVSDQPTIKCPQCHFDELKKIISSTSFQLKGTGWYVTDFRDKGKPKPASEPKIETKSKDKPTKVKDSGDKSE